jgi:hypothetical protein
VAMLQFRIKKTDLLSILVLFTETVDKPSYKMNRFNTEVNKERERDVNREPAVEKARESKTRGARYGSDENIFIIISILNYFYSYLILIH